MSIHDYSFYVIARALLLLARSNLHFMRGLLRRSVSIRASPYSTSAARNDDGYFTVYLFNRAESQREPRLTTNTMIVRINAAAYPRCCTSG